MALGLIFAGGVGERMKNGAKPKQFLELHGKAVIIYTLEVFEQCNDIDGIVAVCVHGWEDYLRELINKAGLKKVKAIVAGGNNPQESQLNGMKAMKKSFNITKETVVLIHDGVRPLVDEETLINNIQCVRTNGSAITVTPAIETITHVGEDDNILDIADRNEYRMAKAPQSYFFNDVFNTYKKAFADGKTDFIDSATLMQAYGKKLTTTVGSTNNIKITTPIDYYIFKAIVEAKTGEEVFG
ncbi:2-C-methyl-D-erythritol 4-phosphate cytidylyltransferase [Loigolactobacillus backii]|uniref:IspD/TarI family cytidylyltransferase n=1 Tax=Loigolactobacillus backii TaxID=375175 RepID=UPI000C1CAB0E|nr:IspD/TarI family cytidylyltransferase [Loigolactobacillus backii]PIO83026.1 2-C-methyl-D-erythritol 4-phosphate cytidylyltransferase [Loigolactobacillus backii]